MNFKNAVLHFNKICTHKYWVYHYCKLAGIPWRGIKHDLSKFSPVEFFESVKYYKGTSSPIDEAKKVNGVSYAWMHHKGRNDHHYEYWQDNFDNGGSPVQLPYECAVEMLCDYLGAGKAYMGNKFTYKGEFEWYLGKLALNIRMHDQTKKFIYIMFSDLAKEEYYFTDHENGKFEKWLKKTVITKQNLKNKYKKASELSDEDFKRMIDYDKEWWNHRK